MHPATAIDRTHIVEQVCELIAQGERVHVACSKLGIQWRQLWEWKAKSPALAALYARAREASAESWEDKATETVEAAEVSEDVPVARLREDNYRWRARVANPKQYGERQQLDVKHGLDESLSGLIASAFSGATIEASAQPLELPAGEPVSVVESPELTRDTEG